MVKPERPAQDLPGEIVKDLMGAIRGSFYGDSTPKQWFQDQHFIFDRVVTYPARWLTARGVTLPAARYKEIVMGVLTTIKHHGDTAGVKYWPRYLTYCMQMHFKVHGEEYYEEGKALRTRLENVVLCLKAGAGKTKVDPIEIIAAARRLRATGRRPGRRGKVKEQLNLFPSQ